MADSNFNYGSVSCQPVRTIRLRRTLPLIASFYALTYRVDLYTKEFTAGSTVIVAMLPWQDKNYAREIASICGSSGAGSIRGLYETGYDVQVGTLADVLFLRMIRQGDGEELVGPHLKVTADFYRDRKFQREELARRQERERQRLAPKPLRLRL